MKLHIGGEQVAQGWTILNAQLKPGVDCVGDIRDLTQFVGDSIDEIYASHVLEHVSQKSALPVLQGIHRVLRPGGILYLSVPDMDILAHMFINPITTPQTKFHVMRMMFGGQVDDFDYHYFGWNELFLANFLTQSGFREIHRVESFGLFSDTSDYKPFGFPISLNIRAIK